MSYHFTRYRAAGRRFVAIRAILRPTSSALAPSVGVVKFMNAARYTSAYAESFFSSTLTLSRTERSGNFVYVVPGSTITTRIPNGRTSPRRESLSASRANFDAQYAPSRGTETRPATELTFTMCPPPWRRIVGRTARHIAIAPNTFTSNCRRRGARSTSSIAPNSAYPALFTRTSIRPAALKTRATPRWIEASSATSISRGSMPGARRRSTPERVRPEAKTRNPRAASARAVASPIPLEQPVTSATRPIPAAMKSTARPTAGPLEVPFPAAT